MRSNLKSWRRTRNPFRPVGQQICQTRYRDLDDLGALALHLVDSSADNRGDLNVRGIVTEQRCEQTDAGAAQPGELQEIGVALWDFADAAGGLRIGGVVSDDRIERYRSIGDGARYGAADVLRAGERNDSATAGEPLSPPDPD